MSKEEDEILVRETLADLREAGVIDADEKRAYKLPRFSQTLAIVGLSMGIGWLANSSTQSENNDRASKYNVVLNLGGGAAPGTVLDLTLEAPGDFERPTGLEATLSASGEQFFKKGATRARKTVSDRWVKTALHDFDNDGELEMLRAQGSWLTYSENPIGPGVTTGNVTRYEEVVQWQHHESSWAGDTELLFLVGDVDRDGWKDFMVRTSAEKQFYFRNVMEEKKLKKKN